MKKIKWDEIVISKEFASHYPSRDKIEKCRRAFFNDRKMDRWIVVNHNNVLIDGYVLYLVLKEACYSGYIYVQEAEEKSREFNKKMDGVMNKHEIYIMGTHPGKKKKYTWKIPTSKKNSFNAKVGDKIMVRTSKGVSPIIITDILHGTIFPIPSDIKTAIV